jgi:hypothetical protein
MEKPSSQIKEHRAVSDTIHIFITPNIVVGIVTKIQAGGFGVQNLAGGTRFFSSLKCPVEFWGPSASFQWVLGFFPGGKVATA